MRLLELFSGTGILSKTFREKGHKTLTLDVDPGHNPDICVSIFDVDLNQLKRFKPTVIWASPPCETFSLLTVGKYWDYGGYPKNYKTVLGQARVMMALHIIKELKPKYWFIENPVGLLRKQRYMLNLPRNTITYCQYGGKYRKPTDIWTNVNHWIPRKKCKNGDSCHEYAPRGSNKGIQGETNIRGQANIERAKLPLELCKEILQVCEGDLKIKQTTLKSNLTEDWKKLIDTLN